MIFNETQFQMKDGRTAILRSPCEEDAAAMLCFLTQASGETDFLMKYPEEWEEYTLDREKSILQRANDDPNGLMIACLVDGKIVGNCMISFRTGIKARHRASVAIAVLKKFWGLGIGTKLFEELCLTAKERGGVRQLELDFIEGNIRARNLYEKMGFRITGEKPDAIRLKDGTFLKEYMMVKWL